MPANINTLPAELLYDIAGYLDIPSIASLTLACHSASLTHLLHTRYREHRIHLHRPQPGDIDASIECPRSGAGATPLMFAVIGGSAEAVHMLIDHGADAVKKQPWRREGYFSPLQLAAAYMQKKVFMLLLHYDLACRDVLEHVVWLADLRSWTRDGSTFYRSVDEEDGAEFHDRDEAIVDIRIRMARALLMRGILLHHPLHLKLRISTRAQDSVHRAIILHTFTPATFGFKLLELIISLGADVNLAQSYGLQMTPLHRAISYFDVDVTKLLLAAGANPNIPDRKGFLALGRLVTVLQQYSFSPDVYYRILERGGSMASFHQAFQTPESPFEHVIRATMDLADVLLSARTVHWNAVLIKDIKIALEIWKEDLAAGLKKRI